MSTVNRFIISAFRAHGTFVIHMTGFPDGLVGAGTGVFVNITELGEDRPAVNVPFIGLARMSVNNIAPNDDGTVDAMLTVEWGSDLNIGLQVLVVND